MGSTITSRETDPPDSGGFGATHRSQLRTGLDGIIGESERVHTAIESPDGVTRVDGADERHVDVAVQLVATDRQLYFVSVDGDGDAGQAAGSLRYDQLAAVADRDGVLELSTVDGVVWRLSVDRAVDDSADALVRHLAWIGDVRSRLISCRNDVELAVGEIRAAADEMDWERGVERYETQRVALDELIDTVFMTTPVAADALAPERTDLERRLERAAADLLIERADSRLTLGQQLVRTGDLERARRVMDRARTDYRDAAAHADAVQRGDAFMFGEQRELDDRLERLRWEIEAVAAEPLRRAHEAKVLARTTTDPAETVEHWETAFRRYSAVLSLKGTDGTIVGDAGNVRQEREKAAGQLIAIHRAMARSQWDDGIERAEIDLEAGVQELEAAIDHLARARELAAEFRPPAAEDLADQLDTMRDSLAQLRHSAGLSTVRATDAETQHDGEAADTGAGEDVTAIDSHHDIQIDGSLGESQTERSDRAARESGANADDSGGDQTDIVLSDAEDAE